MTLSALFAADPIFSDGLDLGVVLAVLVKALLGFAFVLVGVIFMIWFERKLVADFQNRVGPNRAGPWGLGQTLADGIKLIFKEDLRPEGADSLVFRLAPYLSVVPAFLTFTVVPIGGIFKGGDDGAVELFGHTTFVQVADPPIGVLFLLAMSGIGIYGAMLAGWASGSKYPLLGSVRASASMISYEAALGLSMLAVVVMSGSLTTHDIVAGQAGGNLLDWNLIATAFVPFFIFCVAGTAELNRPPFDFAEAEQELVGGFHTEYSSMRFGMFYLAEFMNTITMSAIIVTLFLGGPAGPIGPGPDQLWPLFWFLLKLLVFLGAFVWVRGTLPRYRYDQLMDLGWKRLIPVALLWLLFIAGIRVGRQQDWNPLVVPAVAIVIAGIVALLFAGAMRTAAGRREHADEFGEVSVMGYFDGFLVTLKKLAHGSATGEVVTTQYPKEKRQAPDRQHGRHVLNRYEDGMEKCIGCELCAGVCPARCIYVRGADNPADDPVSPGERYGYVYEINYLRCIHCDLCVEACPTEAITESKLFEFSFTNRLDAIYTKAELVVDDDGNPKHLPWEDWSDAEWAHTKTSQWVRATAPNGSVAYEGRVAWSGDLGWGVREPELGQAGEADLTVAAPTHDDEHAGSGHDDSHGHGGGH